jgi:hypothetical protein
MMVEGYPNLKEEVGGSNPGCEISSLLDGKNCQAVNCLSCFGAGMSAFCLEKGKEKEKEVLHRSSIEGPDATGRFTLYTIYAI